MEKMIFANQKMYFNELKEVEKFQEDMKDYKDKFVVIPSDIYLQSFLNKNFIVGAQNVSGESEGAYTGQTSAKSLKDLNVKYIMIGHYEVRNQYNEDNNLIQRKIDEALKNNLQVILCVGETIEEKINGKTKNVIKKELEHLNINKNVIISYEPVWAIASNITPTNEEIENIVNYIKELKNTKVLYGGSVSPENIEILNKIPNLNGFLLGSKALKSSNLKKIIEVVK
ncbi:MAG: triosephosphate isomerase [Bacilli bacterium]|nr:triosephosphate isomerase [Bacilli bacterium]